MTILKDLKEVQMVDIKREIEMGNEVILNAILTSLVLSYVVIFTVSWFQEFKRKTNE